MIGRGPLRRHGFVGNCSASMAVGVCVCVWCVWCLCSASASASASVPVMICAESPYRGLLDSHFMRLPVILATTFSRVLYYAEFATKICPFDILYRHGSSNDTLSLIVYRCPAVASRLRLCRRLNSLSTTPRLGPSSSSQLVSRS
jgi:hypothetical protein